MEPKTPNEDTLRALDDLYENRDITESGFDEFVQSLERDS